MSLLPALVLAGCLLGSPEPRLGMIETPEGSGLMYGSTIEKSLVTDAAFYRNNKIKIRTRNTSGDLAFDLNDLANRLETAMITKGYEPTQGNDFGLILDVNVVHSGHIQHRHTYEYAFLGAAMGRLATVRGQARDASNLGAVGGAALGAIIGENIADDTYMIIANVTFGVVKKRTVSKRRVTFSRSTKIKNLDDPDEDERQILGGFKRTYGTHLAVYAGGRNVKQREITEGVRSRVIRIVSDFL
ncbi:complement resistance protein TraT [Magnetospira sp. QH-2]|uniref:complement resistance protein TraT n=1 Tax=Magnetospira sp. (strain QH-2) TaxID=1288970 RepID=UPI00130D9F38|nr:complement resistance protein TraT [Magnetospira sp. QH-2]